MLIAIVLLIAQGFPQQVVSTNGRPTAQAVNVQADPAHPLSISGTISASTSCKATAAAPTYVEGTNDPLSCDLSGVLRASGSGGAVDVTDRAGRLLGITSTNVTQFGGTNLSTGTGTGGAGIPRVTVSNDSQVKIWDSTNTATVKAASTAPATTDTALVVAQSPQSNPVCTSFKPISQTTSTDLITSTNKLHICAVLVVSATAQSLSLVEGTGSVCATGVAAVMGATTAANGMALAANGGWTMTADRAWLKTATTADHLCLLQSGAGNVSGVITYVDAQ